MNTHDQPPLYTVRRHGTDVLEPADGAMRATLEEGRRRQGTLLFADMASYTSVAESLGEEKTYLLMSMILREMSAIVRNHHGTLLDYVGDGILAAYGAPVASENAPVDACRTALGVLSRMAELEDSIAHKFHVRPGFRIAIHCGPIVFSQQFKAVGDAVNFAARLQAEAERNTIIISEAANVLVSTYFETKFLGERAIKGKSTPQRVYALLKPKTGVSRFDLIADRGLSPFIARSAELNALHELWAKTASGAHNIVQIIGEAGIGKSRLIFEFRKKIPDGSWVVGQCYPDSQSVPFKPFIDVLRTLFLIREDDNAASLEQKVSQGLFDLGLQPEVELPFILNLLGQEQGQLFKAFAPEVAGIRTRNALLSILRMRCRRSTLAIIIEDLHWIDTASEDCLVRLARDEQSLPLLLVASYRPYAKPAWQSFSDGQTITLAPLSGNTAIAFLQARMGTRSLPASLRQLAINKTQGNPLFLEEMSNYLRDSGQVLISESGVDYRPSGSGYVMPLSLESLLLERFDTLGEDTRCVLECASVIGQSFPLDVLQGANDADGSLSDHLALLEGRELIFREPETGGLRFKHALVRDAIYNRLLTPVRQRLHECIALRIEESSASNLHEVVDALADHYAQTTRSTKTAHYMALAGAKALQVYSLDEAEQRFRSVLALADADAGCADDDLVTEVVAKLARALYYRAEFGKIVALVEPQLTRVAATGDKRRHSRLLFEVGYAYIFSARGTMGRTFLEEALALAGEIDDPESIAYASLGLMFFYLFWASPDAATRQKFKELSDRVTAIAPTLPDVWVSAKCLNCRWAEATFFSRFAEARELCLELFELSRQSGDPRPMGFGYWQMAISDLYADRYDDAIANGHRAMQIALAPLDHLCARSAQGGALVMQRPAEALKILTEVRQQAEARRFVVLLMMTDVFYGAAIALAGQLGRGVQWIHQAVARAETWGNPHFPAVGHMVLGELYLHLATASKPPLAVMMKNLPFLIANAPRARARSRQHFEESIRLCRSVDMPGHLSRSLLGLGLLHKANKKTPGARECLAEALAVSEAALAGNIASKAREALSGL